MGFSRKTELQLRDQARRVKHAPYFRHDTFFAPRLSAGGAVLRATVTTAIPTGTLAAPSTTGKVTVWEWNSQTNTSTVTQNPAYINARCCNDHTLSASVPSGTTVKVAWIDGDLWLLASDCY